MILKKKYAKGFTLIEVIVVMVIMAILSMVIVPACFEYINKARERVCRANCLQIQRMYDAHLTLENRMHSDIEFNNFLLKYDDTTCPSEGYITYVDGKVMCIMHQGDEKSEDDDNEVPIL